MFLEKERKNRDEVVLFSSIKLKSLDNLKPLKIRRTCLTHLKCSDLLHKDNSIMYVWNMILNENLLMYMYFTFETDYTGSKYFITDWQIPWLQQNYGDIVSKLRPYGVIVMDTVMEYNTSKWSQTVPVPADQVKNNLQSILDISLRKLLFLLKRMEI